MKSATIPRVKSEKMKCVGLAWLLWCLIVCAAQAQGVTNKVQSIHLDEAIQMALQHNLNVQIQRYSPLLDKFALEADYGVAYDPQFVSTVKDTFIAQPGQLINGIQAPQVNEDDHSYAVGIGSGNGGNVLTPWGLQYSLGTTLDRTAYTRLGVDTNGLPFPVFTQSKTFAGLTLDQPLLKNSWIDSARANILMAKKTIQYDELAFRQLVMTNISLTEQTFDELNYALGNVKVQEDAVGLAAQLVGENKRKVQAGVLTALDVAQSQSQLASARAALLAARQLVVTDENALKSLITDKYRRWFDIQLIPVEKLLPVPERFDLEESWQTALAKRPDILQARVNVERLDVNRRFQKNQLFPQLDVTGSYGRTGLSTDLGTAYDQIPGNNFPSYSYGMILSFPLGNRAARNNYKAAKAYLQQAQLQYQLVEQNMLIQVQNTIETARSDFEQINATRDARVYAEEALNAEQRKLEVGTSTPFVVLQLQSNLTAARSAEIRALADYNEALVQLSQYEGTILERHHLTVKIY
ncbi:MAG TPA: TolC family protein [Candidatus Saccharimonadales bacterium]|nr:TolC family protein [Candidatus Saccharimonadales bacterium]